MTKWNFTPPPEGVVLVCCVDDGSGLDWTVSKVFNGRASLVDEECCDGEVLAWMPAPELPTREEIEGAL